MRTAVNRSTRFVPPSLNLGRVLAFSLQNMLASHEQGGTQCSYFLFIVNPHHHLEDAVKNAHKNLNVASKA